MNSQRYFSCLSEFMNRYLVAGMFAFGFALLTNIGVAHAGSFEEEKATLKKLNQQIKQITDEMHCIRGRLGRTTGFSEVFGAHCQRLKAERERELKQRKIKVLTWPEFFAEYKNISGDSLEVRARGHYDSCSGNADLAIGQKGPSVTYACDFLLEAARKNLQRAAITSDPWVGTKACHIRKNYVKAKRATDGCSVPLSDPASKHFKGVFRNECNAHDVCYNTPDSNKQECDQHFHDNMRSTCRGGGNEGPYKVLCNPTADAWATGVVVAGWESFHKGQEWASAHCEKGGVAAGSGAIQQR